MCVGLHARSGWAGEKVTYLEEALSYLGQDYNLIQDEDARKWRVLDNSGAVIFGRDVVGGQTIECSNGTLLVRSRAADPRSQLVTVLSARGEPLLDVPVASLKHLRVADSHRLLFAHGPWLIAEGSLACNLRVYSLVTGKRVIGDAPEVLPRSSVLLAAPLWQHVWIAGPPADGGGYIQLTGYDGQFREVIRKRIGEGRRLHFACGGGGYIGGVIADRKADEGPGRGTVFTYDLLNGELKTAVAQESPAFWHQGVILQNILVVWGRQIVTWIDMRAMETVASREPSRAGRTCRFARGAATHAGERIALVNYDQSRRLPTRILVYTHDGEQLHDVALRPGWVDNLKFVGRDELLVFARNYVARVRLKPGTVGVFTPYQKPLQSGGADRGPEPASAPVNRVAKAPAVESVPDDAAVPAHEPTQAPESGGGAAWGWLVVGVPAGLALGAALAWLFLRKRLCGGYRGPPGCA
jgi:hypothetical protein